MKRLAGPLLCLAVSAVLAGCARSSYAGIPLAPGAAPPHLQQLAQAAMAGDKQAQLRLGIAYEEGQGVPLDLDRARHLYRLAATTSGGTIHVYSPPVGRNGRGQVIPVNTGPIQPGLAEAKLRLVRLGDRRRND